VSVLVGTGGSGFTTSHLAEQLMKSCQEQVVLDDLSCKLGGHVPTARKDLNVRFLPDGRLG
jgi:UDP-glucose 4-epimerase